MREQMREEEEEKEICLNVSDLSGEVSEFERAVSAELISNRLDKRYEVAIPHRPRSTPSVCAGYARQLRLLPSIIARV